jgi:exodeoxyribonuclease V beta subunit
MATGHLRPLVVTDTVLSGLQLIEANAGTGKTWTIAALYLRLLCEVRLPVESILVVTFTEAATAELRGRIRERIAEARAAFASGTVSDDALLQTLLERISDHEEAGRHLTRALYDFDQAAIYTIHGFCQRVLGDRAFESGAAFEAEMLPDLSDLLLGIADDFWRAEFTRSSSLWAEFVLDERLRPEVLLETVRPYLGKPYLEIRAPTEAVDVARREQDFAETYVEARQIWSTSRAEIGGQLVASPGLNRSSYGHRSIPGWLLAMDGYLRPQNASLAIFDKFSRFTARSLRAATKKGGETPSHAFFVACERLEDAWNELLGGYQQHLGILHARLLEYCNSELAARKRRRQVRSFDDLLLDVHAALAGARGVELAKSLRASYCAALIDEFQDTDTLQYGIFKNIYEGTQLPVFLVGDPKQAIYSFRGADIYAYLEARRDAQQGHTLERNWRSAPRLIGAVNAIFENAAQPFVFDDIPFQDATPAETDIGALCLDDDDGAPLEMWFVGGEDAKPSSKADAIRRAAAATAGQIAQLLNQGAQGKARIRLAKSADERALMGGDIAVLVRKHEQARAVNEALQHLGIASVQRGAGSVFATQEAEELERLLLAVAEPGRERLLRAALATELLGLSAQRLHALDDDVDEWELVVEEFRDAHRRWHEHGFITMMQALLGSFGTFKRLLRYPDGERRATNLRHLVELLQRVAGSEGVTGLPKWLAARRQSERIEDEEDLLRLESDANLVKIFTVHVSKGLEFPLVFCPFLWDGKLRAQTSDIIACHDVSAGSRPVLDLGSERQGELREQALREELSENLRLLYVALTRAKYRCWVVWGHIKDAEAAALAWLLHRPASAEVHGIEALADHVSTLGEAGMLVDLQRLATRAHGAVRITSLPGPAAARFTPVEQEGIELSARHFQGAIREAWRMTSFTGLTRRLQPEAPDYDGTEADTDTGAEAAQTQRLDIFGFPRGATAGKCLHAIFEHLDFFRADRATIDALCAEQLAAHGFAQEWTRVVADMVQQTLATPLDESGSLRLAGISNERRLNELEFSYPIAGLNEVGLRRVVDQHGLDGGLWTRVGNLRLVPGRGAARGFMKGYIDLVFEHEGRFYLVDYKSNWLGPALEHYRPAQVAEAMARDAYHLQYLIYCVALHRYLRSRLSGYGWETHFGGVRYLFLRGMRRELGAASGVFQDRPSEALIRRLDTYLEAGEV